VDEGDFEGGGRKDLMQGKKKRIGTSFRSLAFAPYWERAGWGKKESGELT